ncbi:MAG TPA: hypothetical protein EYH26_01425 [Pyrodictium sp.]|nr:hypothetical protein [Pyrodictium sp.]HIQ55220.1 hypothetical protein [Pyrodictium sp.]
MQRPCRQLFNLMVAFEPRWGARNQVERFLSRLIRYSIFGSSQHMLFLRLHGDPFKFVEENCKKFRNEPLLLRLVPVDVVCQPKINVFAKEACRLLGEKALKNDKIAIRVEGKIVDVDFKRRLHKSEIIDAIIANCERKYEVNLSNPTLIVLIRSVNIYRGSQRYVAISVVRPSQIYSRYSSRLTCLSP